MEFSNNIVFGQGITKQKWTLNTLKKGKGKKDIYIVCFQKESKNLLEIIDSLEIFKNIHKNKKYIVAGISFGKKEGKELAFQIICDFVSTGKDISEIKNYILERFKE